MAGKAEMAPSEALGVARLVMAVEDSPIILAAHSEAQAARLASAAQALAPGLAPVLLPGWDCLPYDRTSPSRAIMGQRMRALHAMASGTTRLVVASVEALAQRLPPPGSFRTLDLAVGDAVDRAGLQTSLERLGYAVDDTADQPGDVALQGEVIDLVPADGGRPVRMRLEGDADCVTLAALDVFDPATQRSRSKLDALSLGPASELVHPAEDEGDAPLPRVAGQEHALPELAGSLVSVFDLLPGAVLAMDPDVPTQMMAHLTQLAEARATRMALCRATGEALPSDGLYLDTSAWEEMLASHETRELAWPEAEALPVFRTARDPGGAAEAFVSTALAEGRRVGLSGTRVARALDLSGEVVDGWAALDALEPGSVGIIPAGLSRGFAADAVVLLGEADVLPPRRTATGHAGLFDTPLRPGDAVLHLDLGLARLDGIETVQAGEASDCLVLGFAGDTRKLVPCAEMDRVWRYGAGTDGVTLDRADGSSWRRRQGRVAADLETTAATLVERAQARSRETAPSLKPPARAMARFIAGFGFTPTPDQDAAFADIAADLATAHPTARLLCGDVGFGKTEAALRAAAACVLAGHQVALLAPTTVLVRQHLATFQRRFRPLGIEVAALSRLARPAEARDIRTRLADGTLRLVIGTQALAAKDLTFADLALVIVDEEQRFGTKAKTALAALRRPEAGGLHELTLSATPIPRTLQGALAGLQAISVLTTPPARRQPVRTTVLPFDEAVLKVALSREHARGGQSFCVCPRIEDLDAVERLLERLAPDLSVVVLHGKMKPDAMDAALVGFSEGHGDVLLSTDIIEAGLDIPRANTILVWRADQFGLAQLHQLRGRVGRGRARGMAWLFTDLDCPPGTPAADRLAALAANDGLGAGFAVAARDLDLRGAGDLLGDEQAGHVKLLGVELARHLLAAAIARHRGEVAEEWRPELLLDLPATIPETYMPDPAARIALHARLARPGDIAALAEELEDRFGPMPDPLRHLLAQAELRVTCHRLGVAKLEAGPVAAAADMRDEPSEISGLDRKGHRLILRQPSPDAETRLAVARRLLRAIARA